MERRYEIKREGEDYLGYVTLVIKEYLDEQEISSTTVSVWDKEYLSLLINLIYQQGQVDARKELEERFLPIPFPV